MAKITSIDERFQHFLSDLKESFWGRPGTEDAAGVEAVSGVRVGAYERRSKNRPRSAA